MRLPLKLTASVKFSPLSPSSPSDPERLCFPLQLIVSTRCQNGKSTLPLRVRQRDAEQKEMTESDQSGEKTDKRTSTRQTMNVLLKRVAALGDRSPWMTEAAWQHPGSC